MSSSREDDRAEDEAMAGYYILRRANGEIFTLDINGISYIAVWESERDVRRSKGANPDLMVYVPALLDERLLRRLEGTSRGPEGRSAPRFFLVESRDPSLRTGREITLQEMRDRGALSRAA